MKQNPSNFRIPFLLYSLNFLARLPFIFEGFGREEDAWGHALYARQFYETGQYEISRLPGHPVFESLLAVLWPLPENHIFFNLILTIASSFSVVLFYQIARQLKIANALWLSFAFSFVPVFFVAGTYTIDYNLALLFILYSFYLLLKEKYIFAGILLGIATGVRISSLSFLIPYLIVIKPQPLKHFLKLSTAAIIVAFLAYLLPLGTYGLSFLDFHKPPFPSWANIIYKLSFGIWGIPMLICMIIMFYSGLKKFNGKIPEITKAILFILILQLLVFIRLPFKAEFLIPAIPFIILGLGLIASSIQAKALALTSLASCFLFGFDYHNPYRGGSPSPLAIKFGISNKQIFLDPLKGPALLDHSKRKNKSAYADFTIREIKENPDYFVIAGWYWPEMMVKAPALSDHIDYYADEFEIETAQEKDMNIFYLYEINEANAAIKGHYLADSLGTELTPP